MNPPIILLLLEHNTADIKAIIDIIGLDNVFKLAPHIMAIAKTLQEPPK